MQNNLQIQCNLYQNSKTFFAEIENLIFEFTWNLQGTVVKKKKRNNKVEELHFLI